MNKNKADQFESYIKNQTVISKNNFPKDLKSKIDKFVSNLNTEVKKYNSGKKLTTKKKPLIIKKAASKKIVKKINTITKVKQVLKQDKKRLKHGYTLTPGNVKIGVIKKMELDHFNETIKKIDIFEKQKENHINALKNKNNTPSTNMAYKNQLDQIKKYLKELKIQKSELKKLL